MNGKWTQEEIDYLNHAYRNKIKQKDIANYLGRSIGSVKSQIIKQKLPLNNSVYKNSPTYKAIYQNYDWCYQKYIVEGLDMHEMAKIANVKTRTIQKWCGDIYHLNLFTFKEHKKLNDIQYQIILSGTLGDGCIFNNNDNYCYIESHSIAEKDYLFWKYSNLKDLCNKEPRYYEGSVKKFGEKEYFAKPSYRMTTRYVNALKEIKNLSKIEKINKLNKLGICLFILDDGSFYSYWSLCVASFSDKEKSEFLNICKNKFKLFAKMDKDSRYIHFDANSSRQIISWMTELLPNDMDILHKKFLNKHIPQEANYNYVMLDNGEKIALSTWCKITFNNKHYEKIKQFYLDSNINKMSESILLALIASERKKCKIM